MSIGRRARATAGAVALVAIISGCASIAPAVSVPSTPASPFQSISPSLDASPSASSGEAPRPWDALQAATLADGYERALIGGDWQVAWDMLAPADHVLRETLAEYTNERSAYFHSVAGRYTLSVLTHEAAVLRKWTTSPELVGGADLARAFIVEADYPALAGNNAGYEVFLVAPHATGTWRIWVVR